eukprot:Protomagalhaensia_sp_Gyna_25__1542@NODE_1794_length_1534_cov_564_194649_g1472_i0_p1_GENE_NODE_1794_length_1534_cov_564_194649_g1472_i0NODE_1794_length_1534_cov_564_194649_g1472_i0_p1_ORF_typecomplete_len326_score25_85_NODE_1794_length_1534_cov_564_194649_g1472_i02581235
MVACLRLSNGVPRFPEDQLVGFTSWFSLRLALEQQARERARTMDRVVQCLGGESWRWREDNTLTLLNYQLNHLFPSRHKCHGHWLAVYEWAGQGEMKDEEPSFVHPDGFTQRVHRGAPQIEEWRKLHEPDATAEASESGLPGRNYLNCFLAPFAVRILLQQPEIFEKLINPNDNSLTPGVFLRTVQTFGFASGGVCPDQYLFGYDVPALFRRHAGVFTLPPETFWDPRAHSQLPPSFDHAPATPLIYLARAAKSICARECHVLQEAILHCAKFYPGLSHMTYDSSDASTEEMSSDILHTYSTRYDFSTLFLLGVNQGLLFLKWAR